MSELFEEDEVEVVDTVEEFAANDVEVEVELVETSNAGLDARRRLENMLDEKRLRDELDDFVNY